MSFSATRYSAMLNKHGIVVTILHVTGSSINATTLQRTNTTSSTTIKAFFRKFSLKEITGAVKEGDRQMFIAANDLSFTPGKNDIVTSVEGIFKITTVDIRTTNGANTVYICVVRGTV